MQSDPARYPRYRWTLLWLAWMTQVLGTWSTFLVPSLAYALFPDLGLDQAQYTFVYTAPLIAPIFVGLLGGGFGDRYGIRLAVGVGGIVVAMTGIARAYVSSFSMLFALNCVQGAAASFITPNLPKLVGVWFPPREFGLASGVYVSGQAVGMSIGLLTGPLFPDWRTAFLTVGLIAMGVAVLWVILGRSSPRSMGLTQPPITAGVWRSLRSRNMWLLCAGQFLLIGGFMTFTGNLPKALVGVRGAGPEAAGLMASMLTWGVVVGSMVLPTVSDRTGLRKPFVYAGAVLSGGCWLLGWHLAPGMAAAFPIAVGGFFLGGLVAVMFTFPLEFPEIGYKYAGGAGGVMGAAANLGGILVPLLVMTPILTAGTQGAYDRGFLLAGGFLAVISVPVAFAMETGRRARRVSEEGDPQHPDGG
jgi:MFS family permease